MGIGWDSSVESWDGGGEFCLRRSVRLLVVFARAKVGSINSDSFDTVST